ncbi:MAG: hypothetical protein BWX47_01197 [candidate division Hyd24-12 bacterium ADurb.Bin004]|nr:MAG: hypothetical protein BWX47_01197 [candidate division Hyd24-12 bacterium ADurb.Bin004]
MKMFQACSMAPAGSPDLSLVNPRSARLLALMCLLIALILRLISSFSESCRLARSSSCRALISSPASIASCDRLMHSSTKPVESAPEVTSSAAWALMDLDLLKTFIAAISRSMLRIPSLTSAFAGSISRAFCSVRRA